jgi:cyanate permease
MSPTANASVMARSATRRAYLLLALASLGYGCLTFVWFAVGAFLPVLTADLSLSGTEAGLLTGIIPLVYVPLSLASGLLIDRVGAPRAIGAGLCLIGTGQLTRSFAPGFPTLLVLTALVGVGGTGLTFGLPKLVAERFAPARSGTMSSVYLLGSYLGIGAVYGLGRAVLGPAVGGWRPLFRYSGVAVLVFALFWILVARAVDRREKRLPASATGAAVDGGRENGSSSGDPQTESDGKALLTDIKRVITHPAMALLVVIGTVYLLLLHGLQNWLATILEARGMAPSLAAGMVTVLIVARAAGTLSIPPVSDRFGRRRVAVIGCGLLAAIGLVGIDRSGAGFVLTAVAVIAAGVGLGGLGPLVRALPIEVEGIGPQFTGTAVGLIFSIGELGGFAGPFLIGTLRDLTGSFSIGLGVFVLAALVVSLAGYGMTETGSTDF